MDFVLPPADDPLRVECRQWIADNPHPTGRHLAEAGLVAPHWPAPWGRDADPLSQLVIDEELRAAGISRPTNIIGIGWAGPTLVYAGTEEQKDRYLMPLLAGEEIWCQLFSEPDSGSDLASLSTKAVRDGDEWVISGSKIWSSGAESSQFGILIARTDPHATKHNGISYFICPMDAPGVEVRPIREMTGIALFNEVFLDEVRLPADALVGEVNHGWSLAKVTLGNERVSLSGSGALWGMGPSADDLVDLIRSAGGLTDPILRQRVATMWIHSEVLRLIRLRTVSAAVRGDTPGAEASVRKLLADEHGQEIMGLAKDLAGAGSLLTDVGPMGEPVQMWHHGYLFARALTIGGGTTEVQRNIIAERVLGLPHDIDPHERETWAEASGR